MNERQYSYYELMSCLRLLKFLNDIGIYEKAVGNIQTIYEEDYYELALRGLDNVAPEFGIEELGDEVCCGGHTVYHFSDPAIPEYYRLCRLHEHKHHITPRENPYMIKADKAFDDCCRYTCSDFGAGFDDDVHVREILIETCPEYPFDEREIIEVVHSMLEYYRSELERLRSELLRGPAVWLPALPAHKKQIKTRQPRKKAEKPLKKAS